MNVFRRALRVTLGLALAQVAPGALAFSSGIAEAEAAQRDWASVLSTHVDERGYVDFRALAEDIEPLRRVVAWVGATSPTAHPERFASPAEVLAFHINAYNALAMHQVLVLGQPKKLSPLVRLKFFRRSKVTVGGQSMSLEAYENDIIRKLGEPRVHWALNCMSESCPRLPREPFVGERLDAQLEREAFTFFSEPRNVRIDHGKRRVYLTEIMKFFPEDFLAVAPSMIAYANRFRAADAQIPSDYRERYTSYDWTVIQQR